MEFDEDYPTYEPDYDWEPDDRDSGWYYDDSQFADFSPLVIGGDSDLGGEF